MATTSVEWITCTECGAIFRVTVPAETKDLLVFSNYQPAYTGATYGTFGSDGPISLGVSSNSIKWKGGYLSGEKRDWDCVKTACPKPGCGQPLWVVCILVSK